MSEFDNATAVTPDGAATIRDGWDINGNANGGYLMAMAARAMRATCGRRDPISVTAHYLAPGKPGPVQIDSTVVKSGRRFSTVSAQMHAAGRPIVQLVGAFGDLSDVKSFEHAAGGPPELPRFDECQPRDRRQGPTDAAFSERIDVRLHPDHVGWLHGQRNGDAEMAGWFAFRDGRPLDTLALLMVCDAFPPAVFHLDMPAGWVPTVEYTVHVRAVPAPGPLMCVFRTQFVSSGFLDEDGEVWDSSGRLVAQSRQLGLTPL
ncbi:MAG: thioesterase family protein [Actinomycetota bacterium]